MRLLVINCSAPHYNLGARQTADWLRTQGDEVTSCDGDPGLFAYGYDRVCLSVIFSWHAPIARSIALRVKRNAEVWCGGPGMFTALGALVDTVRPAWPASVGSIRALSDSAARTA